ncbi:MAG: GGDEF domain-containing protein [Rhodospirillaceae bacterium]|nr:GGDEF domain-containing protein [Rhodospirillaceae bacterium]MBT6403697.1 GGDEF domain-containing protein [Rhodospirillaceae bacterium]
MARAARDGKSGALLYIDLDNFKAINDNRGHEVGDTVLCDISTMLTSCSRIYDLVARIGGDEFAIWLNDLDIDSATKRADEFLAMLSQLADRSGDLAKPLGASIGLARFEPATGESLRELLIRADDAMYAAKRSGKNGWAVAGQPDDLAVVDTVAGSTQDNAAEPHGGRTDR